MVPRESQPPRGSRGLSEADTVDLLFLEHSRTRRAQASLVLFVWRRTQRSRPPGADRYCVGAGAAAGAAG